MVAPVINSSHITRSNNDVASVNWNVSVPAVAKGDLVVINLVWDDSVDVASHNLPQPACGARGSLVNSLAIGWNGNDTTPDQRISAFYFVAANSWGTSVYSVIPNALESWGAAVVKIPFGHFDQTTPVSDKVGLGGVATAISSIGTAAFSASAIDSGGRICVYIGRDVAVSSLPPTGYTDWSRIDHGTVGSTFATKTNSETTAFQYVTSAAWSGAGETNANISYIIRGPNPLERNLGSVIDITDPQTRYAEAMRLMLSSFGVGDAIDSQKIVDTLIYLRTLNSNVPISDGDLVRYLVAYITGQNSIIANDSILRTLDISAQTYERTLQSGIELSDAVMRNVLQDIYRILQSDIAVSDSILSSITGLYARVLSDNIELADSISLLKLFNHLLQSNIVIEDFISSTIFSTNIISRVLLSVADVTDGSLDRQLVANYFSQNNISIEDLIVRVIEALGNVDRILQDSISVEDFATLSIESLSILQRILTSTTIVSDGDLQRSLTANYITFDSVFSVDVITRTIEGLGLIQRTLNDAVTVEDFINSTSTAAAIISRTLQSLIGVFDLTNDVRYYDLRVIDSAIDAYDSFIKIKYAQRFLGSSISISDLISTVITFWGVYQRTLSSVVDVQDSILRERTLSIMLTSAITTLSDSSGLSLLRDRLLQSNLTLYDFVSRVLEVLGIYARTLNSEVAIADTSLRYANYIRLTTDLISISDDLQSIVQNIHARFLLSATSTTDAHTKQLELTRAIADIVMLADLFIKDANMLRLISDNIESVIDALLQIGGVIRLERVLIDQLNIDDVLARDFTGQILRAIIAKMVEMNIQVNMIETAQSTGDSDITIDTEGRSV